MNYLLRRIEVQECSFNYIYSLLCEDSICRRKSKEYKGQKSAHIVYIGHNPHAKSRSMAGCNRDVLSPAFYSGGASPRCGVWW